MKAIANKSKKFTTPHETKAAAAAPVKAKAERDAFGGRIGTRMSKINLVVIKAGRKGATTAEVAKATGEKADIVSQQLSWMFKPKAACTRQEEKNEKGRPTFRYFVKTK